MVEIMSYIVCLLTYPLLENSSLTKQNIYLVVGSKRKNLLQKLNRENCAKLFSFDFGNLCARYKVLHI